MQDPLQTVRRQWTALLLLGSVHFTADLFGGLVPAVLPALRNHFTLSLTAGVALLTVLNITTNSVQVASGHWLSHYREPYFLSLGLVLAAVIGCIPLLPATPHSLPFLFLIMVLGGTGIAIVHPEGLRAVHLLDRIPSSLTTACFMVGGFLGFAGGAYGGSRLVEALGLPGLGWLWLCPVIVLTLVARKRIRLAVEAPEADPAVAASSTAAESVPRLRFRQLLFLAIPLASSSTLLSCLLPTYLNERGATLSYGGASVMLLGAGGALGIVFWGYVAHRAGYLRTLVLSLFAGLPALVLYLAGDATNPRNIPLLLVAGFCPYAAYPLIVTMARHATGLRLGSRMGLIVGGVWGAASLVLMALGPVADHWGVGRVVHLAWTGYLISGVYGLWLLRSHRLHTRLQTAAAQDANVECEG
jgi:FSR family fosmidomycin resistance protein-like MFS transporter